MQWVQCQHTRCSRCAVHVEHTCCIRNIYMRCIICCRPCRCTLFILCIPFIYCVYTTYNAYICSIRHIVFTVAIISMCSISTYSAHTQCKDTVCMHCTLNTHKIFSAHPQHILDTNSACNIFCTYSYVSSTRNINRFYSAPYHIYVYVCEYIRMYICIHMFWHGLRCASDNCKGMAEHLHLVTIVYTRCKYCIYVYMYCSHTIYLYPLHALHMLCNHLRHIA